MSKEIEVPAEIVKLRKHLHQLEDRLSGNLNLGHEINDKLAIILGAAEHLWEGIDKKDFYLTQNIRSIITAVDRIKQLNEEVEKTVLSALPPSKRNGSEWLKDEPDAHAGQVNILLADDDKDIRMILGSFIDSYGYNVMCASDGSKALEIFKSSKVDLVITDVKMPNLDGIKFLKEIKKSKKNIPVILITGFDKRVPMKLAEDDEEVFFLRKPFKQKLLREVVDKALKIKT